VLVTAETGSGKTTQLPQYLADAGWSSRGRAVAVALPTRVAVLAAAARVAHDRRVPPADIGGRAVGYALPLHARRSPDTAIVYFTSAALVAVVREDPMLSAFSVVMVDDAHERSVTTDLLLAMLRIVQARRGDLRIVVASASLSSLTDFVDFYGGPPAVATLHIPGRAFPVRLLYARSPVADYLDAALELVKASHAQWAATGRNPASDVLVFVPGVEQTRDLCDAIAEWAVHAAPPRPPPRRPPPHRRKRRRRGGSDGGDVDVDVDGDGDDDDDDGGTGTVYALPLHASLSPRHQLRALEQPPPRKLKIVVATPVAELSLTIDGVATVVDCGLETLKVYSPTSHSFSFATVPISRASAAQRAGRAGRTQPGTCYRLYTRGHFEAALAPETPPEILRGDLSQALLMLKAVGVDDVGRFGFVVPPPEDALAGAMARLHSLGALGADGRLTRGVGERLADIPLPAHLGRAFLAGERRGVGRLLAVACSMLHVSRSVFTDPGGKIRDDFAVAEGDVVSLINVYRRYVSGSMSAQWCRNHGVCSSAMAQAHKIFQKLRGRLRAGCVDPAALAEDSGQSMASRVCRSLAVGMFANLCLVQSDGLTYRAVLSNVTGAAIHPSSVLAGRAPRWVVAADIVTTRRVWLHNVTVVQPHWVAADLPSVFETLSAATRA
jgi:HrpA-like RNA helicase